MDVSEEPDAPVAAGVARVDGEVCVFQFFHICIVAMLFPLVACSVSFEIIESVLESSYSRTYIQHVSSFPQNRPTPFPLLTVPI